MPEIKFKKRRANGDGSIFLRKDGRWMGRYYITLPDGARKRQQIIGKDRQTVVKRMHEEMTLADKGSPIVRDNRTLGEYLEYWLAHISAPRVRATTQENRNIVVRRHIIEEIGHYGLTALKPVHVRQLIAQLNAKGRGAYTQKRVKQLLSTALKDAMKLELVSRNVALLVDTPKHRYKERRVWDKSQVLQFLDYVKSINHRYYPLFVLLFHYGMRRGEVLGLRWQDVDFAQGVIRIRQTLTVLNYRPAFSEPKTRASKRDLPLLPQIRVVLAEYRRSEPEYTDNLLFHSKSGNPVDPRSLLTTFNWLSQKAGLPKICLHEIRHTVATLLKDSGVTPKDAQVILGHNDITTTLQIYTHASADSKVNAMNALAANLRG